MIAKFFDTQKNKKKEYKLNATNNLKKENQLQKQKHVQLGESMEQEINYKDEIKRQQFTNYLIDKIKNLEVELKETKEQMNEYQEKISTIKIYDELIYNFKNKLQEIEIEKNDYKQQLELTKTQIRQQITITENKNDNIVPITNIPTIYIIYQYKYKYNTSITGFGDFIRGCFYILQFSEKYNIHFDFNIYNHSLKKYLNYFYLKEDIINTISKDILFFQKENCQYFVKNNIINYIYRDVDKELLNIIKQTPSYNKNKYLYLINHPNERFITEQHKNKMRELFEPTLELQTMINNSLSSINLIKYKYITIHIRMNDSSFNENYINFKNEQINYIINVINSIKKNKEEELFLISSNNVVKKYISQKLPKTKTIFKEISHIGESKLNNDDSLINTLTDFYIMSYSKHIYSFSVYEHGSGFSKWCAKIYNVPYICLKI